MSVTHHREVKAHPLIDAYIRKADEHLAAIGLNEHGHRHVELVSRIAKNVLLRLGHPKREVELAEIAGYVHDIGNALGRTKPRKHRRGNRDDGPARAGNGP